MKTQLFAMLVIAFASPVSIFGQCQASFGDYGNGCGSCISNGVITGGSCSIGNCSPKCEGPYISVFGGLAQLQDQRSDNAERSELLVVFPIDFEIGFSDGIGVGIAIGKRWNRNFRTEFEYVYRENEADSLFSSPLFLSEVINSRVAGESRLHTGLFNGYIDLPVGSGRWVPYLGAGIGVTGFDSAADMEFEFPSGTLNGALIGNDSSFAFQWMAGLTCRVCANAELFVEYRYFEATDPRFTFTEQFTSTESDFTRHRPGVILESEYVSNDVFVGIRMNF